MIVLPNLGLIAWNLTTDPYDSGQLAQNLQRLDDHNHSPGKGAQVPTDGIKDGAITNAKLARSVTAAPIEDSVTELSLVDDSVTTAKLHDEAVTTAKLHDDSVNSNKVINGSLLADDLAVADQERLGLSSSSVPRRGVAKGSAPLGTSSTSYVTLSAGVVIEPSSIPAVADAVRVFLPTDGLILLTYQALWASTASHTGSVAIFLNSNQLTSPNADFAQETSGIGGTIQRVYTVPHGLEGVGWSNADATTGQVVEPCCIFADAGTYDVSVRYKVAAGGTINGSERKLRAWTMSF